MKRFKILSFLIILSFILPISYYQREPILSWAASITKGLIGEQDRNLWDGVTSTFTRTTSTGGTITLKKVGNEVDALMVYGGGVNYTGATIQTAITTIGTSNKVTLTLKPGTWTLSANLTIPSNITLKMPAGTVIAKASTYTLAINGPFEAGNYQVFSGFSAGDVTVGNVDEIRAEWFGLDLTGTTVDNAATLSIAAMAANGKVLSLPAGTITLKSRFQPASNSWIRGAGKGSTILKSIATFSTDEIIDVASKTRVKISDLTTDGNSLASFGIQIDNSDDCEVFDTEVKNTTSAGIEILGDSGTANRNKIYSNEVHDCTGTGILLFANAHSNIISLNTVKDCTLYHILIDGGTTGGTSKPSNDNIIAGNIIKGTSGWGIAVEGSHRNLVEINQINLTTASYGLTCDRDNTTVAVLPNHNVFSKNLVNGGLNGMRVDGEYNRVEGNRFLEVATTGISIDYQGGPTAISHITLKNNYIAGGDTYGINVAEGNDMEISDNEIWGFENAIYDVTASSRHTIKQNRTKDTAHEGILVGNRNMTDIVIEDNFVMNASIDHVGTYNGILLAANAVTIDRVSMQRNTYTDDAGTATALRGVGTNGTPTNTTIKHNVSLRSTVDGQVLIQALTGAGGTPSLAQGNLTTVTVTSAATIAAPVFMVKGDILTVIILQDGTGGWTVSWNVVFKHEWSDTGNTANKRSSIQFFYDGTNWIQMGKQTGYY